MSDSRVPSCRADPGRQFVHGGLRIGHPNVLGLGAVDQVPEDPADPGGPFRPEAVRVDPALAEVAVPAGRDAGQDHLVADVEIADRGADFGDGADTLMAEDPARRPPSARRP